MAAAFHDDAVVDDGDDVRVDNGGKSVRDQNRSPPLPRLVQRILHDLNRFSNFEFLSFLGKANLYLFAFGIEGASRLVQQQNLWLSN